MEFSFFPDKKTFDAAEQRLNASGGLEPLFTEFLHLTGTKEADLKPVTYDVAIDESS
jgi:hypothetical protein